MVASCRGNLSFRRTARKAKPIRLGDQAPGHVGWGPREAVRYYERQHGHDRRIAILWSGRERAQPHGTLLFEMAANYVAAGRSTAMRELSSASGKVARIASAETSAIAMNRIQAPE